MNTPAVANLSDLRDQIAPRETTMPNVRAGFADLAGFELVQRAARALAASTLVPKEFQGNMPNCMIALEMANRIGASPLMTMQNLYVVHGRPGWSAKFLIATFNQCGRFTAIRYEWQGKEGLKSWGCRAYATEKATGEQIKSAWITWKLVEDEGWSSKAGSKWKTMPEQMFMYRAAAWMVNTHAPEISMGLNTTEELGDTYEAERAHDGGYVVTTESLQRAEDVIVQSISKETGEIKQDAEQAPEPGKEAGATLTFAKVADSLAKAKDIDVLSVAADLIDSVADTEQQEELRNLYQARRLELSDVPQ